MILTPNASLITRIARPQKSLLSSFVRLWAGQGFYIGTTAPAMAPLFKVVDWSASLSPLALVWCFVVIFNVQHYHGCRYCQQFNKTRGNTCAIRKILQMLRWLIPESLVKISP